ncbi:MAG: ribbon-helix-helix domain-containing protein [Sulfuricellaceae bacterium]|nr:ribbon-helix-helix domain-containing protein [Sulfuricellaceae bacterium]
MSMVSVRLPDSLLEEVNTFSRELHIPRAEYVRLALEAMNHEMQEKHRRERLKALSLRVRGESMKVNAEFDGLDDGAV